MKIRYVTYKKWAGYLIRGSEKVHPNITNTSHINRAVLLAAQLEGPKWGTVQSYDGVGMSGGLLHHIAVHRNGAQGSFFQLLRNIELTGQGAVDEVWTMFRARGWYISQDGRLRQIADGKMVSGVEIVEEFTGPKGVAPRRGDGAERAKNWIAAFHRLLSDRRSFMGQVVSGQQWLLDGQEDLESQAYRRFTDYESSRDAAGAHNGFIPDDIDLAMCVYHAFSVNAPGKAKQYLRKVLNQKTTNSDNFAPRLIKALGTSNFARWKDMPDNKRSRYDSTRVAAGRLGLWPKPVVSRLMPVNF